MPPQTSGWSVENGCMFPLFLLHAPLYFSREYHMPAPLIPAGLASDWGNNQRGSPIFCVPPHTRSTESGDFCGKQARLPNRTAARAPCRKWMNVFPPFFRMPPHRIFVCTDDFRDLCAKLGMGKVEVGELYIARFG